MRLRLTLPDRTRSSKHQHRHDRGSDQRRLKIQGKCESLDFSKDHFVPHLNVQKAPLAEGAKQMDL